MANTTNTTKTNWSFLPIHKSRIIRDNEKYQLIKIDDEYSTVLPKVFKRKKESDTHIYYSLPQDMVINIRKRFYSDIEECWQHSDKSVNLETFMKFVDKKLDKEIAKE